MRDGGNYMLTLQGNDGEIAQANISWKNGSINSSEPGTGFLGYLQLKENNECVGYVRQVTRGANDGDQPVLGDVYEFKRYAVEGEDYTFAIYGTDSGYSGLAKLQYLE